MPMTRTASGTEASGEVPIASSPAIPSSGDSAAYDIAAYDIAASVTDPELPMLGGVLFDIEGESLHVVTTDRYRMAVAQAGIAGHDGSRVQVIVPTPLADAMRALLNGEGPVRLSVDDDRVTLEAGGRQAAGQCLDHDFPDYRRLLPQVAGRRAVVEVAARSIGGLCARSLRFGAGVSLEELIIRHAIGAGLNGLGREAHDFRAAGASAGGDRCPVGAVRGHFYLESAGVVAGRVGDLHVQFGEVLRRAHVDNQVLAGSLRGYAGEPGRQVAVDGVGRRVTAGAGAR